MIDIRTQIKFLQELRAEYKAQYFAIPVDDLAEHKKWLLGEIDRIDNGIESLSGTLEDISHFKAMVTEGIK